MIKYLFVFVLAFLFTSCVSEGQQSSNLPIDEFAKGIQNENAQLLDVRTIGEYQNGHLKNALQANWNNEEEFFERVKSLDKSKPIYTYCLSGARSNAATEWLNSNGYKAYNLIGGINSWRNSNKPIESASAIPQMSAAEYLSKIPNNQTVLVDFSAEWCPPCKKMKPIIDSLKKSSSEKFTIIEMDGGSQTELCKDLNIEAFPTFLIYKQGKLTWRKQGVIAIEELQKELF